MYKYWELGFSTRKLFGIRVQHVRGLASQSNGLRNNIDKVLGGTDKRSTIAVDTGQHGLQCVLSSLQLLSTSGWCHGIIVRLIKRTTRTKQRNTRTQKIKIL